MARRSVVLAVLAIAACTGANAQAVSQAPEVTLKSNPRLVVVDVVVTDSKGQTVSGLTREDFTIFEEHKAQRIVSFEAHTASSDDHGVVLAKRPKLKPNEYTNVPEAMPRVVNIVLLDTLNTPLLDQTIVRRKMLLFLKRLPRGQSVAVFTLGTRLRMIQGVTGISDAVVASVEKILSVDGTDAKSNQEREVEFELISDVQQFDLKLAKNLAEFLAENEAQQTDRRVAASLEALRQIARAVAAYPGRKNLIWLSGGFPISFVPGDQYGGSFGERGGNVRAYGEQLRKVTALLSAAQVAVYPVDARGLLPFSAPIEMGHRAGDIAAATDHWASVDRQRAMDELAEETGGKAFYNTNDFEMALAQSFAMGSSYYTLAYSPPSQKWDGSFRHIQVKAARKGLALSYRSGYFAVPDDAKRDEKQLERDMQSAMMPVSLNATSLLLKAVVRPPGPDGKVEVRYFLDPGQIATRDAENNPRDLHIDFVITAWDAAGQSTGTVAQTVNIPATRSEALSQIERTGLTKFETLTVKPGTTRLRVGVRDRNTGKIGTVEVPLTSSD